MTGDGVFIGTDATEYWSTEDFSTWTKPHFDRKKTWSFKAFNRNIYFDDQEQTAWFDELLETHMGICRGSGVLILREGKWKIAQYVLSPTIPNEIMKKVTVLKGSIDSNLIIKSIFDKYGMKGSIIFSDRKTGKIFGYNPACWDSSYLPASTFKIVNLLIGLETGVIDTGFIFRWNGEKRRHPQWERDLTVREAFRVSCVPCFQELARKIGYTRMTANLEKLGYPGMSVQPDNIEIFWLEGSSRISPRQQLDFLMNLQEEKLPLKKSVMREVKSIMVNEVTDEYTLFAKTGWAIRNGNNYGWFVGYMEEKDNVVFFVTLVEPKNQEKTDDFASVRKIIAMEVFHFLCH
jgi:beta-lactamase class D